MRLDLNELRDYLYYVLVSFIVLLLLVNIITINGYFLRGSIINYKNVQSDEFDGTVYPIEYVPDPFLLTYDERKQDYDKIDSKYFIKMPLYDPQIFGRNPDFLDPTSSEYEETVTERLIYTIPYLSTYNFDYKEYSGSHPGVDIIVPKGTPVHNIANGVVVETNLGSANFGNYIVIRHDNVPMLYGKTTTIYSLYGHLNSIGVEEGTKVSKGDIIGEVGSSGIATTEHLHFQIDLEKAPFHPYWPFTGEDMKNAGVDFFDAVNIGLGKKDAIVYTMNPMKFVNKHLDYQKISNIAYANDILKGNSTTQQESTKIPEEKNIILESNSNTTSDDSSNESENIEEESNNTEEIKTLEEEVIEEKSTGLFSNMVSESKVKTENKNEQKLLNNDKDFALLNNIELAVLGNTSISNNSISNNEKIYDSVILEEDEEENIKKDLQEESIELTEVENSDDNDKNTDNDKDLEDEENIEKSINDTDNDEESESSNDDNIFDENNPEFEDNQSDESNNIDATLAKDSKSNLEEGEYFTDIGEGYRFIKQIKYFKKNNIISGYQDGSFRPDENITRAEALKMILLSYNAEIEETDDKLFEDVDPNSWENNYINTAIKYNLIEKKSDDFKPNDYITRVEFIKILSRLEDVDISFYENNFNGIDDLDDSSWSYKYMNYAFESNLLPLYENKIYPNKNLNREELVSIIYNVIN